MFNRKKTNPSVDAIRGDDTWSKLPFQNIDDVEIPESAKPVRVKKVVHPDIIDDINVEPEKTHDEGYEEGLQAGMEAGRTAGFHAGYEKGLIEAQEKVARENEETTLKAVNLLNSLVKSFSDGLDLIDDEVTVALTQLALKSGQKMARHAFDTKPEVISDVIRELIHTEPTLTGRPRVWLHPEDHIIVSKELGEELTSFGWSLVSDDSITRGGCRVTSPECELDATWEQRWAGIAMKFFPDEADLIPEQGDEL
jgi:flagellar assembly protein FliH